MYQIAVNIPIGHNIDLHFPFQDPPKFTEIGIFGMKIYHLSKMVIFIKIIIVK
jgi:hypothetical protein